MSLSCLIWRCTFSLSLGSLQTLLSLRAQLGSEGQVHRGPPAWCSVHRSESQPHSIWSGRTRGDVMECEPLDVPVQMAALLSGTKSDRSSFYLGVKGIQCSFSVLTAVHKPHYSSILTQYNYLLFLRTTQCTVNIQIKLFKTKGNPNNSV